MLEIPVHLPWPERGDRLLQKCKDWRHGAEFTGNGTFRHVQIWDGNMIAGHKLIDACEKDGHDIDRLIYPILFNYRHALELGMKWVINTYGRFSTIQFSDLGHHDLWKLWCLCKDVIADIGIDEESILSVEQIIKDFHDIDKSGETFRYANSKDGKIMVLPDYRIDLPNIRNVMEGLDNFFDAISCQFEEYKACI